jgi:hypothetical protein
MAQIVTSLNGGEIMCRRKAKMSALSKVEVSVSAPFWESEAVISMGMVVMSKREPMRVTQMRSVAWAKRDVRGHSM